MSFMLHYGLQRPDGKLSSFGGQNFTEMLFNRIEEDGDRQT